MSELDVFSEGRHFMVMMHLPRRSALVKHAIAGQNGAAAFAFGAVAAERRRMGSPKRRQRRR